MVFVKNGPFPDVLWPFGEENCKARTKILAPRMEEGLVLREGSVSHFPKGRLLGSGVLPGPPLKGGIGR